MRKEVIEIDVQSNGAIQDLRDIRNEVDKLENSVSEVNDASKKTSEGFEEVTKNGGAIAILDQLTGGLATRVRDAYEATKLFNFSLKGTKTALIATGIGALVVALGAIVAYWDEISDFVTGVNKKLEEQNALIKDNLAVLDAKIKTGEAEKALLEAQGKSTDEIVASQKILLEQKRKELQAQIPILESQLAKETSLANELSLLDKILIASGNTSLIRGNEEEIKAMKERAIALEAVKTALLELNKVEVELLKPKEEPTTEDGKTVRNMGGAVSELESPTQRFKREQEELFTAKLEQSQLDAELRLSELQGLNDWEVTKTEIEKENAEERIAIAEAEANAKQYAQDMIVGSVRNSLSSLSALFKQGTAASKAAALADIIIGTGVGFINALDIAQKSARATGPAAAYAFPVFYATQISAVLGAAAQAKNILSQAKGGGSVGGASLSGGSRTEQAQAPSFNIVGQSSTNQLAEGIATAERKPLKAYVLSNDVTTGQSLDRNIIGGASIG